VCVVHAGACRCCWRWCWFYLLCAVCCLLFQWSRVVFDNWFTLLGHTLAWFFSFHFVFCSLWQELRTVARIVSVSRTSPSVARDDSTTAERSKMFATMIAGLTPPSIPRTCGEWRAQRFVFIVKCLFHF